MAQYAYTKWNVSSMIDLVRGSGPTYAHTLFEKKISEKLSIKILTVSRCGYEYGKWTKIKFKN